MCRSNVVDLTRADMSATELVHAGGRSLVLRLARLTTKYNTLLALRVQREHAESNGVFRLCGEAAVQRRRLMRALAGDFPGALRELDCWTATDLTGRLADLSLERARAYSGPHLTTPKRLWVRAVLAYHDAVRARLNEKKGRAFLSPKRRPDPLFATGMVSHACADVAYAMDCTPAAVRGWLFGADEGVVTGPDRVVDAGARHGRR